MAKNKNILELQKRREEALASALMKISNIHDFTKMYKMKNNIELMTLIMSDLKSKIKFTQILTNKL